MDSLTLRTGRLEIYAETSVLPEGSETTTDSCLQDAEQHIIQNSTPDSEIVYPILTSPTELIIKIFIHCLPDKPSQPSPSVAPMLLGTICRQWRKIAWNTPAL
ncbi:hypothetical protein C8R44DRAFT_803623 [Mycena epipterygia]|nr:hypothetical protein C8R44DRAFT_803623 [Mycena epipterygia]